MPYKEIGGEEVYGAVLKSIAENLKNLFENDNRPALREVLSSVVNQSPELTTAIIDQLAAELDVNREPSQVDLMRDVGAILSRLVDTEPAMRCYDALLGALPNDPAALWAKASLLQSHRNKNYKMREVSQEEAMSIYGHLRSLFPDDPNVLTNLVNCWIERPMKDDEWSDLALESAGRIGKFRPDYAFACYRRGVVLEILGRRNEVLDCYAEAITLDPEIWEAQLRLSLPENATALSPAVSERRRRPTVPDLDGAILESFAPPESIARSLREFGFVLIRDVMPKPYLEATRESLWDRLRLNSDIDKSGMTNIDNVLSSAECNELITYVGASPVMEALKLFFQEATRGWPIHIRWPWQVQWRDPAIGHITEFHQDMPTFVDNAPIVTWWFPLTPCGPGIAPSVLASTAKFRSPIWLAPFHKKHPLCIEEEFLKKFLKDSMIFPEINPGDALLFTTNLFHQTHLEPGMSNYRMSFDARFVSGPSAYGAFDSGHF